MKQNTIIFITIQNQKKSINKFNQLDLLCC